MSEALIFTDNAFEMVWALMREENNFNLKLRVYVTGGGCSGFQYGFSFDEVVADDDTVVGKTVDENTVQLLVDPLSLQYLRGATIDYDTVDESFVIINPNAKTTCGCGSSFAV